MLGDISKRMADPVSHAFDKHHAAFQAKEMRVLETKPHEGKTDLRLKSVDTKNFLKVVTTATLTSQIVNVLDRVIKAAHFPARRPHKSACENLNTLL